MRLLLTFYSVSAALYLQKILEGEKAAVEVMPVPRAVSSSCGYAVGVENMPPAELLALLAAQQVEWETLYQVGGALGHENYEALAQNE